MTHLSTHPGSDTTAAHDSFSFGAPIVTREETDEERELSFADYLVRAGRVRPAAMRHVLRLRKQAWRPFGALAMKTRKMTVKQVQRTLEVQAQHAHVPFGQVACIEGFLDQSDVVYLLRIQRDCVPTVSELLVRQALFTRAEVRELRVVFDEKADEQETPGHVSCEASSTASESPVEATGTFGD